MSVRRGEPRVERAVFVVGLVLTLIPACTPERNDRPRGASPPPSAPPESTSSSFQDVPYTAAPTTIRTEEGLVFPVPSGWIGQDLTPQSVGTFWNLFDSDPGGSGEEALGIVLLSGAVTASNVEDSERCPDMLPEARLISCGFVDFGNHHWRRIVGEGDLLFVDFVLVLDETYFRLIGTTRRGQLQRLARVEASVRRATIEVRRPRQPSS